MSDLDTFSKIPDQVLRPWLETQRVASYKILAVNKDRATLHQEQGKVQLLEEMIKLLDRVKGLR